MGVLIERELRNEGDLEEALAFVRQSDAIARTRQLELLKRLLRNLEKR